MLIRQLINVIVRHHDRCRALLDCIIDFRLAVCARRADERHYGCIRCKTTPGRLRGSAGPVAHWLAVCASRMRLTIAIDVHVYCAVNRSAQSRLDVNAVKRILCRRYLINLRLSAAATTEACKVYFETRAPTQARRISLENDKNCAAIAARSCAMPNHSTDFYFCSFAAAIPRFRWRAANELISLFAARFVIAMIKSVRIIT